MYHMVARSRTLGESLSMTLTATQDLERVTQAITCKQVMCLPVGLYVVLLASPGQVAVPTGV